LTGSSRRTDARGRLGLAGEAAAEKTLRRMGMSVLERRFRLRSGEIREAEALLRAAWEGDRSLVSAAATLARCLALHQQRYEDALEVLRGVEGEHGALALVHVVRSEIHLEAQDGLYAACQLPCNSIAAVTPLWSQGVKLDSLPE